MHPITEGLFLGAAASAESVRSTAGCFFAFRVDQDAGAIHKQHAGIPSISVSTPGRYLHTPISIARLSDWKNTFALIYAALTRLTPEILQAER